MVIKFNPQGRVVMVFGRKQEASDEETGPATEAIRMGARDRVPVGKRALCCGAAQLTGAEAGTASVKARAAFRLP